MTTIGSVPTGHAEEDDARLALHVARSKRVQRQRDERQQHEADAVSGRCTTARPA